MYRIRVDGRKRRFSNTMTSCLGSRFALRTYDLKTLRVDADFLNTEENVSVFQNTRLRVDGQIRFENATCGCIFLLNTEKKISVFENTRLCVDGAKGTYANDVRKDSPIHKLSSQPQRLKKKM